MHFENESDFPLSLLLRLPVTGNQRRSLEPSNFHSVGNLTSASRITVFSNRFTHGYIPSVDLIARILIHWLAISLETRESLSRRPIGETRVLLWLTKPTITSLYSLVLTLYGLVQAIQYKSLLRPQ